MNILEELSKFGIGRRMPNDTFFAEGDALCKTWIRMGVLEIDDEELCHNIVTKFPCDIPGCTLVFDSLLQYELHYNSSHRYYCSECKKRLPSPHILELHVLEKHDSFFLAQAERKPMYGCYIEDCPLKFHDAQERHEHCINEHQFPPDYRFDDFRKQKSRKNTTKNNGGGCVLKMEVDLSENKAENKGSNAKKKKQSKQQVVAKTVMGSNEQMADVHAEHEKMQSDEKKLKQSKNKNKNKKTQLCSDTSNDNQMEECNNTEGDSFKMRINMENSMKEKSTDHKRASKTLFHTFTFGRGQGRGGRFIPWHKKNTSDENIDDTRNNAQIWENSDLMTALEESVMDT